MRNCAETEKLRVFQENFLFLIDNAERKKYNIRRTKSEVIFMSNNEKNKTNKSEKAETKNEQYLRMAFTTLKRCGHLELSSKHANFNDTEMRLIGEVLAAKYRGERLISTQLAKRLGLTRSAISQIVNRLEEKGAVRRVADDVDRKIAYIETTEKMAEQYSCEVKRVEEFLGNLVTEFGEEDFFKMCELLNKFVQKIDEEKNKAR